MRMENGEGNWMSEKTIRATINWYLRLSDVINDDEGCDKWVWMHDAIMIWYEVAINNNQQQDKSCNKMAANKNSNRVGLQLKDKIVNLHLCIL